LKKNSNRKGGLVFSPSSDDAENSRSESSSVGTYLELGEVQCEVSERSER